MMPMAARVYRALLRLAPAELRRKHRPEMEAAFAEALGAARAGGAWAVTYAWCRAIGDIAAARLRGLVRRPPSVIPEPKGASMFGTDLRYTFRWLARQKSSTLLVVLMLTLGIGANIIVFTMIDGLFLRPLPFPREDRLVYINTRAPKWNLEVVGVNYPDFVEWRRGTQAFEAMGIWDEVGFTLSDGASAERIDGAEVTFDFAAALGVAPILGRTFTEEEDRPNGPSVVMIGERVWRERFGGTDDVLGRSLRLNNVAHTIVGVLPRTAEFPGRIRLWVPLRGDPAQSYQSYGYAGVIARLKPGVRVEAAEDDLLRAQQPIWDARDKEHNVSPYATTLRESLSRNYRLRAQTLLSATAILMLVACANVASIMLARALVRRREMGIRLAVGASRTRLARQLFLENLVLAAIGGTLGLAAGYVGAQYLIGAAGDQVPAWATFGIDWRTALFTAALTLVTTLLFGWAPALHAVRGNLRGAMHAGGAGSTRTPGGRRTLSILVAAEFALAALLLISVGLLLRAYARVQAVDPGFRVDHAMTFTIALPRAAYGDRDGEKPGQRAMAFWDRLTDRLKTLPGVEHAGLVSCPPLGCHWGTFYDIEGRVAAAGDADPVTLYRPASPGYFDAMGIRLKRGRFFNDSDGSPDARAIIVNETFVRTFWPGVEDPIGRRIREPSDSHDRPWMTVVGLVEDIKHYGLEEPMRPGVYLPLRLSPERTMTVALHTRVDPASIVPSARAAVRELDPDLALYRIRSMEEALRQSMRDRRTYSWLLGMLAMMALALALGGTYGVTTYLVSQRTKEIGIRVALGARVADVARTVLGHSLALVLMGGAIGAAGSLALSGVLGEMLFGVPPYDPAVLASALGGLLVFGGAVNALPARRAARVDPVRTLRAE